MRLARWGRRTAQQGNKKMSSDCTTLHSVLLSLGIYEGNDTISSSTACCDKNTTLTPYVVCNANKTVTELRLSNMTLDGTVPATLAQLKGLVHLDLSINSLTGQIPNEVADLYLEWLDLSGNRMSVVFTSDKYVRLTSRAPFQNSGKLTSSPIATLDPSFAYRRTRPFQSIATAPFSTALQFLAEFPQAQPQSSQRFPSGLARLSASSLQLLHSLR
jgi:hypothetical protein